MTIPSGGRRIDRFLPQFDAAERHATRLPASPERVWAALFEADLAGSFAIRLLMGARMLPELLLRRRLPASARGPWNLRALTRVGFGVLDEDPGREIVLGVEGRFWRPAGNLQPFERGRFERPVEAGLARAAWNFTVEPANDGSSVLSTETRVLCGDPSSRRKFRAYWFFVRPGSGLIRHVMLAAVRRELAHPLHP